MLVTINAPHELRAGEFSAGHSHIENGGGIDRYRIRPSPTPVPVGETRGSLSGSVLSAVGRQGGSLDGRADGQEESATVEVEIDPDHRLAHAPVDRVAA